MTRNLFAIFLSITLLSALGSCRDDILYSDGYIGEGESSLEGTVSLDCFNETALGTRTAGDAMDEINSLWVVVYDENGTELLKKEKMTITVSDVETETPVTNGGNLGNTTYEKRTTKRATFEGPKLGYGKYRIYAVANVDLENYTDEEISTAEKLRSIRFNWKWDTDKTPGNGSSSNKDTKPDLEAEDAYYGVEGNNQMFGYFTIGTGNDKAPDNLEAPIVTINQPKTSFHAWLRRLASKVTVAYDGSKLKEGVFIYLQSVQIRHIPSSCALGYDNTPGRKDEQPNPGAIIQNGEIHYYTSEDAFQKEGMTPNFDPNNWPTPGNPYFISKGHPYLGDKKPDETDLHAANAPFSLFFYENMQGIHDKLDKRQDPDGKGVVTYPGINNDDNRKEGYKDKVPYGTYIEVKAYYSSLNSGRPGQNPIIYRFMLGKNIIDDFNAQRNTHYKLTMVFNGYANDVDWHIEYEQPPVSAPVPYYISYLYNRKMMCPIQINTGNKELGKIEAEITDNPWYPDGAQGSDARMPGNNGKTWGGVYYKGDGVADGKKFDYNGFLSLWKTEVATVPLIGNINQESNKAYYNGEKYGDLGPMPPRGKREYVKLNEDDKGDGFTSTSSQNGLPGNDDDRYYVDHEIDPNGDNIYNISIPMYTRAKQLIKPTAFTGNNPYAAYQRQAEVTIKAYDTDGKLIEFDGGMSSESGVGSEKKLVINQVRRVVNPKGVYRKSGSNQPFHVVLKRLPSEESTVFESFRSDGRWKAYVVGLKDSEFPGHENESDLLKLDGGSYIYKDTVFGESGSFIDFWIKFDKPAIPGESKDAIVRVQYHNYTCDHLIFCKSGYEPVAIVKNGTEWYPFNMVTKNKMADDPRDEGSMFRFGNWDQPIASENNVNSKEGGWYNVTPDDFVNNAACIMNGTTEEKNIALTIEGSDKKLKWSEIGHSNENASFGDPGIEGARMAEISDYEQMFPDPKTELLNYDILQGYGVLYADGATETANEVDVAYGYNRHRSDRGRCGMRGCFIYNRRTDKNIFFPIGQSGYGHRINRLAPDKEYGDVSGKLFYGTLRYSCNSRWGYFPLKDDKSMLRSRPLFWDIYRRPGAIYWVNKNMVVDQNKFVSDNDFNGKNDQKNKSAIGWDFNYYTFDFYPISSANVFSGLWGNKESDAVFIRCVKK